MIRKLCGAVVVGAIMGAIMPMGCSKSEPSPALIPQRAHYGEFGYLQGLDDDATDRLLRQNEEIADKVDEIQDAVRSAETWRLIERHSR